jgi:hypothetical protein
MHRTDYVSYHSFNIGIKNDVCARRLITDTLNSEKIMNSSVKCRSLWCTRMRSNCWLHFCALGDRMLHYENTFFKKESVSLWLAAFCLTKSLLCNVTTYSGILFTSKSSFQKCAFQSLKKILCSLYVKEIGSQDSVRTAQSCVRMPISVYCSSLHLSRCFSNTFRHSSEFEKNPTFKCIRPNDMAIPFGR